MSDLLVEVGLPIITLLLGWLTSAYRNKQKKEKDILDNVQQVIDIQREFINKQNEDLSKLEKKFNSKTRAVKAAYDCHIPSNKCPVLISDAKEHECDTCIHNMKNIEEDD